MQARPPIVATGKSKALLRLFLRAKKLAGSAIDEVEARARLADDGLKAALRIVRSDLVGQPVLHVQSRPGTSKKHITHRAGCLTVFGDDVLILINVSKTSGFLIGRVAVGATRS